jgi:hypothetical protein
VGAAVLAIASAALGAGLTFVFTSILEGRRRRWALEDSEAVFERTQAAERMRRVEERAELAANELLPIVDALTERLRPASSYDSDIPDTDDLTVPMRRLAVQLGDTEARKRIESVAHCAERTSAIMSWQGDRPSTVMFKLAPIARNALGHVLSGEELSEADVLDEYEAAIEEEDSTRAQAYEEERTRRASEAGPD